MTNRKKKKKISRLAEIQHTIYLLILGGILILSATLPGMLREYEYLTASDTLRSWKYEYSARGKHTGSDAWFEVDIGGRIHKITAIPYMPWQKGTPHYADELEDILDAHIGDTVDYIYRRDNRSTIVHMAIGGEVIVDQEIIMAQRKRSHLFGLILSGSFFATALLLFPYSLSLKRRRTHARISHRRSSGRAPHPRR